MVLSPSSKVSPGRPKMNGVLTVRPTSFAALTARRVCSSVIPFRIAFRFFWTPLSAPKRIAQHPASLKARSSGVSTWFTQAEANQAKSSRRALISWAIPMARS